MTRAKKSLGQNFITSQKIVDDIVDASKINAEDVVLEIGPGKGMLTETLLEKAGKVIAIEKDDDLIEPLKEKFDKEIAEGKLTLVHGDALEINIDSVIHGNYTIVANIPYYITGALFRKFFSEENLPDRIIVMVQKEVAKRIVARDNKESILSMSVKAYGTPRIIQKVPARFFTPRPKVDSAVLEVSDISRDFFKTTSEDIFFNNIKAGFAHKRKLLIRNLEVLWPQEVIEEAFNSCNVSLKTRPENVTLQTWECLIQGFTK